MPSLSFDLTPEAALKFWESKIQLSPKEFYALSREAKTRAFAVSGIAKGDELNTVYTALQDSLKKGTPFSQFQADSAQIFAARGWTGKRAWRIDNIFRTNIQTAYNVGRYQQMLKTTENRPFWRYSAVNDRRTRPAHRAMHGKIFPHDHPFWDTWFPLNGFRCRCSVDSVSQDDLDTNNWQVEERDPTGKLFAPTDPVTGVKLPARLAMPDPGWDFHVGKAGVAMPAAVVVERAATWAAPLAVKVFKAIGQDAIRSGYATWIAAVRAAPGVRHVIAVLGVMSEEEVAFLAGKGRDFRTAAITIEDRLVVGKKAARHKAQGNALTDEEWDSLPEAVIHSESVLYDNDSGNILYVMPSLTDPRKVKVVVEPGLLKKGKDETNAVLTVFKVGVSALLDREKYTVIRGNIE